MNASSLIPVHIYIEPSAQVKKSKITVTPSFMEIVSTTTKELGHKEKDKNEDVIRSDTFL